MPIAALRRLCVPFLAVAVAIGLLALSSGDSKAQWIPNTPQFQPTFDVKLCNDLPADHTPAGFLNELKGGGGACVPDTSPGGHPDITTTFIVPQGNLAYNQAYWVITGGANETRLDGDQIGGPLATPYDPKNDEDGVESCADTIDNDSDGADTDDTDCHTDGNAGNPASYDATLTEDDEATCANGIDDAADGADAADTDCYDYVGAPAGGLKSETTLGLLTAPCDNTTWPSFVWFESEFDVEDTIACLPEGTDDRWTPLKDDDDAFAGVADADSDIVTYFPDCTLKLFDPDGDGIDTDANPATIGDQPVQPRARFAGLTKVSTQFQMLHNIEFLSSDLRDAFLANPNTTHHPFTKLPSDGFANLVILNDPMTVTLQPNPISDFCTVLGTAGMLLGQIDTDDNGTLDTDRVTSPGTPGSYMVQMRTQSYRDADGDGLQNDMDTCVWTSNTASEDPYNSTGPDEDMLDSACDPCGSAIPACNEADEDGDEYLNNQDYCPLVYNPVIAGTPPTGGELDSESGEAYNSANPDGGPRQDQIGDTCDSEMGGNDLVSDGLYFNAIHVDSVAITGGGVVDGDGDGWGDDVDPDDADANNPGQMTHTPMDAAGIKYSPSLDSDGDSYSNLAEWYMGSDPGNACPAFTSHDAWPSDMDNSKTANLLDLLVFKPAFNCNAGDACYKVRVDLDVNDSVNLLDLLKFKPDFNDSCTFP